mgnify:CR=1 FL=1
MPWWSESIVARTVRQIEATQEMIGPVADFPSSFIDKNLKSKQHYKLSLVAKGRAEDTCLGLAASPAQQLLLTPLKAKDAELTVTVAVDHAADPLLCCCPFLFHSRDHDASASLSVPMSAPYI